MIGARTRYFTARHGRRLKPPAYRARVSAYHLGNLRRPRDAHLSARVSTRPHTDWVETRYPPAAYIPMIGIFLPRAGDRGRQDNPAEHAMGRKIGSFLRKELKRQVSARIRMGIQAINHQHISRTERVSMMRHPSVGTSLTMSPGILLIQWHRKTHFRIV